MRFIVCVGVLAAVAFNVVAVVVGRGYFLHSLAVLAIAIYVGTPALVLGGCAYLLRDRFRFSGQLARVSVLTSIVSASTLISLLPGRELAKHDIATAKTYCDALISQIEREKQTRGVYPPDLSAFWHPGDGPRLVRSGLHYSSDGAQYEMTFGDPRGIMNFVSYSSKNPQWSEWH